MSYYSISRSYYSAGGHHSTKLHELPAGYYRDKKEGVVLLLVLTRQLLLPSILTLLAAMMGQSGVVLS